MEITRSNFLDHLGNGGASIEANYVVTLAHKDFIPYLSLIDYSIHCPPAVPRRSNPRDEGSRRAAAAPAEEHDRRRGGLRRRRSGGAVVSRSTEHDTAQEPSPLPTGAAAASASAGPTPLDEEKQLQPLRRPRLAADAECRRTSPSPPSPTRRQLLLARRSSAATGDDVDGRGRQ